MNTTQYVLVLYDTKLMKVGTTDRLSNEMTNQH
jgi:hypothetical protein